MHIASMSLGIFDFLIDWIATLVGNVIGWIFDIVMGIVNRMIFTIAKQILFIIDLVQVLFRRLAGLDKYYVNTGTGPNVEHEGDILISLMSNETVLEVFITLTLVAVAMVIIATIIKVVQSEFTTEGSKNSKGGIIGQAIKSLVMFILVPVLCFGGVFVSNALLKALDSATSQGAESSMASQVFVSAASSANKIRFNQASLSNNEAFLKKHGLWVEGNQAQTALNVDNAFRKQTDFGDAPASLDGIVETVINTIFGYAAGGGAFVIIGGANSFSPGIASYQNIYMVGSFYDIGQMNMIILIGGSIMACYVMIMTSFGLVMRLFKASILFMISPPVIAIAPLDNGNVFQSWRKQFVSEVLAGYGAILGLNLFFTILPILNNIDLFPALYAGTYGGSIFNDMAHLLFTIVGLYMVKDLIKMVGDISGGSDALGNGTKMAKDAGSTVMKVGMAAAGAATGGVGLIAGKALTAAGAKGIGSKLTSLGQAGMRTASNQLHFGMQKLKGAANNYLGTDLNAETDPVQELEKRKKQAKARKDRADAGASTLGDKMYNGAEAVKGGIKKFNQGVANLEGENGGKFKDTLFSKAASGVGRLFSAENGVETEVDRLARTKKTETSDALKRGATAAEASSGDQLEIGKSAEDMKNQFDIDPDKIGEAMAIAIQHANNAKEGEQSQQIWRSILEQLKQINDMKGAGADKETLKKAMEQLNVNMAAGGTYGEQMTSVINNRRVQADLQAYIAKNPDEAIDMDKLKAEITNAFNKNVAPALSKAGKSADDIKKELDKTQESILSKIREEVDKAAPK